MPYGTRGPNPYQLPGQQPAGSPQEPGPLGGSMTGMRTPAPLPLGQRHGYMSPTSARSGFRLPIGAPADQRMGQKPPPPDPYGSQSGPGILEQWFNQRAAGTDPAFEYASKRGMQDLGTRSAAAGGFNSGAARQQESDFMANLVAQRMGQLDALAGGASGEHQNRLDSMFRSGLGLAGGQSGINSAYDLAAGNAMNQMNQAILSMFLNKAGVDQKSNQQGIQNLLGGLGAIAAF